MKKSIELESKITFIEQLMDEMNQVIYSQQKELDFLKKNLKDLQDQIKESNDNQGNSFPVHEKPPHY